MIKMLVSSNGEENKLEKYVKYFVLNRLLRTQPALRGITSAYSSILLLFTSTAVMTCRTVPVTNSCSCHYIHSFIHQYSALEARLAGTRAQSCDRYGSGTLHPGEVLGGRLQLLSPTFRRSHIRRQVPVRPQRRKRSQQRKVELGRERCPVVLSKFVLQLKFRDLLRAANL